jgi:hypothetical protein
MIEAAVGPDHLVVLISEGATTAQDDLLARLVGDDNGPGTLMRTGAIADLLP